jgi:phage shock protein A
VPRLNFTEVQSALENAISELEQVKDALRSTSTMTLSGEKVTEVEGLTETMGGVTTTLVSIEEDFDHWASELEDDLHAQGIEF